MLLSNLDIFLVVILILFSFIGLIRGFLKELSSIIYWVGSFYFTSVTKPILLPKIEKKVAIPFLPDIIANVTLFIIYIIILSIIMNYVTNAIKKILPHSTNGLLGFIFGFIKGILISIFILTGINIINENSKKKLEILENSIFYNYFNKSENRVFNNVMESLLGNFLKEIQKNKTKKIIEDNFKEKKLENKKDKNNNEDMEKLLNILVD